MTASPLHSSPIPANSTTDVVGLHGASRMGFSPMPVQRSLWHLLEAKTPMGLPLYESSVVEVPRRAGKTDGIFALCVGRCETIDDYQITYAAQSGAKSRERFYTLLRQLRRHGQGGWRERQSRGEERIEWDNGSILRFAPPKAENFRGDALDLAILDEAQEHDEEDAADLLGSLLPVFDTRPDAQLVVAGTAGASRDGLLWEALENGRGGTWGILEYALRPGMDPDDETTWLQVHPGPAGVSPERALEVLRMRHAQMEADMFGREYLGIWPEHSATMVFPADLWASLGVDIPPAQPTRFGLAFEVTPDGERSAVTATWRAGALTWGGVLKEAEGMNWVAPYAAALATKHRLPVWHDSTPNNNAVASLIARDHRNVTTHATTAVEFASACALLHSEVMGQTFRHSRQPDLDSAVAVASKRTLVDGGWAWGRKASSGNIAPLVSISVGLKAFDSLPAQRITRVISAKPA